MDMMQHSLCMRGQLHIQAGIKNILKLYFNVGLANNQNI